MTGFPAPGVSPARGSDWGHPCRPPLWSLQALSALRGLCPSGHLELHPQAQGPPGSQSSLPEKQLPLVSVRRPLLLCRTPCPEARLSWGLCPRRLVVLPEKSPLAHSESRPGLEGGEGWCWASSHICRKQRGAQQRDETWEGFLHSTAPGSAPPAQEARGGGRDMQRSGLWWWEEMKEKLRVHEGLLGAEDV